MTRRDYIRIAAALRRSRPDMGGTMADPGAADKARSAAQWAADVSEIARALAADNPRFDLDRFWAAADGSGDPLTPDITRPEWADR